MENPITQEAAAHFPTTTMMDTSLNDSVNRTQPSFYQDGWPQTDEPSHHLEESKDMIEEEKNASG